MRTLYFDIDGTVLLQEADSVKTCLGDGALERAIRDADISSLVCVGSFVAAANMAREVKADYDGLGAVFRLCKGAFQDLDWFRSTTSLVANPGNRAAHIDMSADWLYVDDFAELYMQSADMSEVFRQNVGSRICVPEPNGDGADVLRWLASAPI